MDPCNIFSSKLATISNLFALQTDSEQDNDACKQFSLQFIQDLEELLVNTSIMSNSNLADSYQQAVQVLTQVCINVLFICPEFSKACHMLVKSCLSLVISRDWMQVDTASQHSLASCLLMAHQFLVPWVGHGFFLAAGLALEPWSHPSLHKILLGQSISQEEVHAYLVYEGHYLCQERIKILLEENYNTHALNLSLYCSHDSEMKKNSIYLETLLVLQDDFQKQDEMWNEIQWHQCSQQVIPVLHSLVNYAVSTAAKVCSMLLLKEWQMETTSLQDMRHITELWVEANWKDCQGVTETFEQRVNDLVKTTDDSLYRMYLADAMFCSVGDEDSIVNLSVKLCLSALRNPPGNPETSYLATSTVDLNNAALCHIIAKMVKEDYSLYRLCLLTAFCITPTRESLDILEEAYLSTPYVSNQANPANLKSVVHCGTVMCMSELLPRIFAPRYTSATTWTEMKQMCERLLRCTKFVASKWTLSNGETVVVKTYVKHDLNLSDASEGDRTATDEESDVCEIISESDDAVSEVKPNRKRGRPRRLHAPKLLAPVTPETSGSDKEYIPTSANNLGNKDANQQYNLRPGRQRIEISGTDTETDEISSSWQEDDEDSWSEKDTSEDAAGKAKVKGHLINGSKVKRLFPGMKRPFANHNESDSEPVVVKRKRGRPRKEEHKKGLNINRKELPQTLAPEVGKEAKVVKVEDQKEVQVNAAKSTALSISSSAISTATSRSTAALTTVAKAKASEPIQNLLKSVTDSFLKKELETVQVSASNEKAKCEQPMLDRKEEPNRLLSKSRESSSAACTTTLAKSVKRPGTVMMSNVSPQKPLEKETMKFPPYKSQVSSLKMQDAKSGGRYGKMADVMAAESLILMSGSARKSPTPPKSSTPTRYPPFSIPNVAIASNQTQSPAWSVPSHAGNNAMQNNHRQVPPQILSTGSENVSTGVKGSTASNHTYTKRVPTSNARPTPVMITLPSSQALSPARVFSNMATNISSSSVNPTVNTNVTLSTHAQSNSNVTMPSSTVSYATTSTSNTPTCSNINILKSSGPGLLEIRDKPAQVPNSSSPNVQLTWTPTSDKDTVTVEYNGKTFKVPVTNVPEGLSRNLKMASRISQGRTPTSQGSSTPGISQQTMSPGRVISIQTPLIGAASNLNRAVVSAHTASPGRQVITVQTPVAVSPNRSATTLPYSTFTDQSGVVYKVNIVPKSVASTIAPSGIQIVPNVQNTIAISTPTHTTQVLSGPGTKVPGSNPVLVSAIQNSTLTQSRANSQANTSTTTVTAYPAKYVAASSPQVGYFQGVLKKFDPSGSTTPRTISRNVHTMGVPTAPTAGSPQRATQHIRIVHSPHRPMTRSQVAPPRPVTRAYARDSPRFAPYKTLQRWQPQSSGKHNSVKTVRGGKQGQGVTKPHRIGTLATNGQATKQMSMRNLNVNTSTSAPRKIIPRSSNTTPKLEILQCSPPTQRKTPRPVAPFGIKQTKTSPTAPSLPPQPQRFITPTQQQLQQHQQMHQHTHQQHLQKMQQVQQTSQQVLQTQQQLQQVQQQLQPAQHQQLQQAQQQQLQQAQHQQLQQVQQQQVQQLQQVQQQQQQSQQVPQQQAILLVPAASQAQMASLGSVNPNQLLTVQQGATSPLLQGSSGTVQTNHVKVQNAPVLTSFPTSVPLFLSSTTGISSQLVISSAPAVSSASSNFPSPFKTIKTYAAGKVRKNRLDSR